MPAFLSGLAGKIVAAGVGLILLLAALLYVQHLRSSLSAAQASVATLTATNKADQQQLAAYQQQVRQGEQAADQLESRLQTVTESRVSQHATIHAQAAQAGQDAPVAPVLGSALDMLRGQP